MMIDGEEYPDTKPCSRCGMDVRADRLNRECDDCKSVNYFDPISSRHNPVARTAFGDTEPGHEIALHYRTQASNCPTRLTLNSLGIPYSIYYGDRDPFEVAYAMGLHEGDGPIEYPIVLVTRHGEYLEHWEGFRLADLNRIPTDRKRILGIEDEPGVPTELKEAA